MLDHIPENWQVFARRNPEMTKVLASQTDRWLLNADGVGLLRAITKKGPFASLEFFRHFVLLTQMRDAFIGEAFLPHVSFDNGSIYGSRTITPNPDVPESGGGVWLTWTLRPGADHVLQTNAPRVAMRARYFAKEGWTWDDALAMDESEAPPSPIPEDVLALMMASADVFECRGIKPLTENFMTPLGEGCLTHAMPRVARDGVNIECGNNLYYFTHEELQRVLHGYDLTPQAKALRELVTVMESPLEAYPFDVWATPTFRLEDCVSASFRKLTVQRLIQSLCPTMSVRVSGRDQNWTVAMQPLKKPRERGGEGADRVPPGKAYSAIMRGAEATGRVYLPVSFLLDGLSREEGAPLLYFPIPPSLLGNVPGWSRLEHLVKERTNVERSIHPMRVNVSGWFEHASPGEFPAKLNVRYAIYPPGKSTKDAMVAIVYYGRGAWRLVFPRRGDLPRGGGGLSKHELFYALTGNRWLSGLVMEDEE